MLARPRRRVPWFAVAVLGAVGLASAAYSNSFENAFHFDDAHVVQENVFIRSLAHVPRYFADAATFSSLPQNALYRPLVTASLALDYRLGGGLDVRQFHRSQFAMHLALAMLLFFFYRAVLGASGRRPWHRWAALAGAAWFAVHTGNTQAVNYISARSELLSALGVVGAFLLYLRAPWSRRWHLYLLPMAAGALAKVPAVVFAPLLLVFVLLVERGVALPALFTRAGWPAVRGALWRALPAIVAGAGIFVWVESMNAPTLSYGGGDRLAYFRTQLFVWLHYGRLFVLPTGLTADTDWGLIPSWLDARVLAGLAFALALGAAAWASSRVAALRPAAFGLAWFVIALLPASSVFPLAEVTNDHRMFLPYIGLTLAAVTAAAAGLERLAAARPARRAAVVAGATAATLAVLAAHAAGTYRRNTVWRTGDSLWRDTVQKSPRNGRALMNYGLTHMAAGRHVEARALFERARVFTPHYVYLEINLGIVNGALKNREAAERHFGRALDLQPGNAGSHYYYGRWLVEEGRVPEAVPRLQGAIRLAPGRPDARQLLMRVYGAMGAQAELLPLARETLALNPADPVAQAFAGGAVPGLVGEATAGGRAARGVELLARGGFLEAALAFRGAILADAGSAEAWRGLGDALLGLGCFAEAASAFEAALAREPRNAAAAGGLARARAGRRK